MAATGVAPRSAPSGDRLLFGASLSSARANSITLSKAPSYELEPFFVLRIPIRGSAAARVSFLDSGDEALATLHRSLSEVAYSYQTAEFEGPLWNEDSVFAPEIERKVIFTMQFRSRISELPRWRPEIVPEPEWID